jgi:predicted DNA binding CopG/RHH family protein
MKKRSRAQIEADNQRTGRPTLPKDQVREKAIRIRLTRSELYEIKSKAEAEGLTVAEYVRRRLLEE